MKLSVKFTDGQKLKCSLKEVDVCEINRKDVSLFILGPISVDVKNGVFKINGLKLPFAFHSDTTEFVLFRRVRVQLNSLEPQVVAIGFGLRNTLALPDGSQKNHIQLFWATPDGLLIGGNK